MAAMVVRTMWRILLGWALLWPGLPPAMASADAQALPLRSTVEVGRPPRPVQVRVEAHPEGGVRVAVVQGRRRSEAHLTVEAGATARLETVRMRGGAQVAVLWLEGAGPVRAAALIATGRAGAPTVAWWGRLDPHGDPGEHKADVLEVADRTGDGAPDVVVGRTRESTRICGQDDTLLSPRAVDPRTLTLRPVVLRRLPEDPAAGEWAVRATRQSPGPTGPPLLDRLVFTAASSMSGVGEDPAMVPAPVTLVDGDTGTIWLEGHGGDGKWEFVTGRFDGGRFPIRAIAVVPSPSDPEAAEALGRPLRFWLVGDAGPRIEVTLSEDPLAHPGAAYWVVPERPLHWKCLSLVLGDVAAPPGAAPGTVRTGIAEVRVYTDLDFGEGMDALVDALGAPGAAGSESAELLASVGPQAVGALEAAWDRLGSLARRRAVRTLAAHASESAGARALLLRAAADSDARTQQAAIAALEAAGGVAADALAALTRRGDDIGDRAAARLAALDPPHATQLLLALLAEEGGTPRPGLRRALARGLRDGGDEALTHLQAWATAEPPAPAAAAVLLAAASVTPAHATLLELFAATAGRAERFEDRWRLVHAAQALPSDETVNLWLIEQATEAEAWMLRAAALPVLARRGTGAKVPVAVAGLQDPYPRVRIAALEAFGGEGRHMVAVATLARRDPWPMVRSAAVEALVAHPRARPVLHAAVKDGAAMVRASAIGTLTKLGDRAAWPSIGERLADPRERAEVVTAAIEHARTLCIRDATGALAARVDRALVPDATDEALDVGQTALRALAALGGPDADTALGRALAPEVPPHLRQAALEARRREAPCQ
jgi:hypothetical protein